MNPNYAPIDDPATPDYVLAVLRDEHRQRCQFDPDADPRVVLSLDTTVREWRKACDLLKWWRDLGRALNAMWDVSCTDAEWYDVLEPAEERRLADVCRLIAARATRPTIRPAPLLGTTCASAGTFLTIRSLLHDSGAPAHEIAPSTPLAPYTREHPEVFLGPVSRLAPGALPPLRYRSHPLQVASLWGMFVSFVGLAVGQYFVMYSLALAVVALFSSCIALHWYAAKRLLPASVAFGDLRTFGDLARVVREASS